MFRILLMSFAAFLSATALAPAEEAIRPPARPPITVVSPPENYVLVAKSAEIAPGTAGGWNWDFFLFAYPEPLVKVHVFQSNGIQVDYGETGYHWGTCNPVWDRELATVAPGDRIRVEVWDKDVRYDDLIGKCQFVLTQEMIRQRRIALRFGQIRQLQLEVRSLR